MICYYNSSQMQEEQIRLKKKILHQLEGANEELKMLETKLSSTSLLKVHLVETTTHSGLFMKKKRKQKSNDVLPNTILISWIQTVILEVHEEYASALEGAHKLAEFGPHLSQKIHALMKNCFTCHLHLRALEKKDLEYFEQLRVQGEKMTLRKAERMIEEQIYDLRIAKESFLQELRNECEVLPQVEANV